MEKWEIEREEIGNWDIVKKCNWNFINWDEKKLQIEKLKEKISKTEKLKMMDIAISEIVKEINCKLRN